MRLAIIIVCYNGRKWLERSLGSCVQHARGVPTYLVDNASTDDSVKYVRQSFPGVRVLESGENLGFAGGNNLGIKAALAQGAEAVFLLNQDAELTAGCLEALTRLLVERPSVAAVQPVIVLPSGLVNSVGNSFHYLGFGYATGYGLTLDQARSTIGWFKHGAQPPYLSGAAVLMRSKALVGVGLFDEALFMYHEDLELSLRLRLAGWALALEPAVRVIHHYEPSRSRKQFYFMERNRFLVWLAYFKLPTLTLLCFWWLVSELPLFAVAIVGGWGVEKARAYSYLLRPKTWRYIHLRREQVRHVRTCKDSELLAYAVDRIEFQAAPGGVALKVFNLLSALVWSFTKPLIRW